MSRLQQQRQPPAARSKRRSGRKEKVCACTLSVLFSRRNHMALIQILLPLSYPEKQSPGINTLIALNQKIVKDKANHAVVLDKATQDKLLKDVQSYRLITVATLVDRLKINGSLARQSLKDLEDKAQIKKVVGHSKLSIYSKCPSPLHFLCRIGNVKGGRGDQG